MVEKSHINRIGNNKGFSIVEVLVAVAILAVVAAPILNSFSTAAKANAKSQKILETTSLAESIMEEVKGKGIRRLHDEAADRSDMSFSPEDVETGKLNNTPPYIINYSGVTATNGRKYDAVVTIDTSSYSDSDRNDERNTNKKNLNEDTGDVSDANLIRVPTFAEVDSSKNAVLSWELNRYDGAAFEAMLDKNVGKTQAGQGTDDSWYESFMHILYGPGEKSTCITIKESGTSINIDAEIEYRPNYNGYKNISYSVYSSSFDISNGDIPDLYIFYTFMIDDSEVVRRKAEHSAYNFHLSNEVLNIIDNTTGRDFDIYLILQKIYREGAARRVDVASSNPLEIKYTVQLNQESEDKSVVSCKFPGISSTVEGLKLNGHRVYSNFDYIVPDGGTTVKVDGNLYDTKDLDKLYQVKVELFNVGETGGSPVASVTSTMKTGIEVETEDD